MRLPWKFSQKTPGFGISKSFFLTVLSARANLPTLADVVSPTPRNGAVTGFGVPLAGQARKEDILNPMERGFYGIASPNRQTVLKLVVVPKEEAGFDPEPFLRSPEAALLSEEHRQRMRATWLLLQLTFETHEAMVYGSLDFLLEVASRLATLTEGVVSDPISRVYRLPSELYVNAEANDRIDARNFVTPWGPKSEKGWAYTLGLQKFDLPEYEMFGVSESHSDLARRFLIGLAQSTLMGAIPQAGSFVGSPKCPMLVAVGGFDRSVWEGIPCFELIPPTGKLTCEALDAWSTESMR